MSRRTTAPSKLAKEPLAPLDTAVANASRPATAAAVHAPLVSRRTVALTLLLLQNASVSLLTRLSRTPLTPGAQVYIPAVAVFSAELIKLSVSLTMLVREKRQVGRSKGKRDGVYKTVQIALWDLAVNQRQEVVKLAVPAALYALQNTLLVSISRSSYSRTEADAMVTVHGIIKSGRCNLSDDVPGALNLDASRCPFSGADTLHL